MKKGIVVALVVLALFVISLAEEKLFFDDWKIKRAITRPDGLLQATLVNPDESGNIKSVVVIASPENVLAYWYFDKIDNPYFFKLKDGQYVRSPENEKTCIRCHKDKVKTDTS